MAQELLRFASLIDSTRAWQVTTKFLQYSTWRQAYSAMAALWNCSANHMDTSGRHDAAGVHGTPANQPFIALTNSQLFAVHRAATIKIAKAACMFAYYLHTIATLAPLVFHEISSISPARSTPPTYAPCVPAGIVFVLDRWWHAHGRCNPPSPVPLPSRTIHAPCEVYEPPWQMKHTTMVRDCTVCWRSTSNFKRQRDAQEAWID